MAGKWSQVKQAVHNPAIALGVADKSNSTAADILAGITGQMTERQTAASEIAKRQHDIDQDLAETKTANITGNYMRDILSRIKSPADLANIDYSDAPDGVNMTEVYKGVQARAAQLDSALLNAANIKHNKDSLAHNKDVLGHEQQVHTDTFGLDKKELAFKEKEHGDTLSFNKDELDHTKQAHEDEFGIKLDEEERKVKKFQDEQDDRTKQLALEASVTKVENIFADYKSGEAQRIMDKTQDLRKRNGWTENQHQQYAYNQAQKDVNEKTGSHYFRRMLIGSGEGQVSQKAFDASKQGKLILQEETKAGELRHQGDLAQKAWAENAVIAGERIAKDPKIYAQYAWDEETGRMEFQSEIDAKLNNVGSVDQLNNILHNATTGPQGGKGYTLADLPTDSKHPIHKRLHSRIKSRVNGISVPTLYNLTEQIMNHPDPSARPSNALQFFEALDTKIGASIKGIIDREAESNKDTIDAPPGKKAPGGDTSAGDDAATLDKALDAGTTAGAIQSVDTAMEAYTANPSPALIPAINKKLAKVPSLLRTDLHNALDKVLPAEILKEIKKRPNNRSSYNQLTGRQADLSQMYKKYDDLLKKIGRRFTGSVTERYDAVAEARQLGEALVLTASAYSAELGKEE